MRTSSRTLFAALSIAAAGALLSQAGCYSNWPPINGTGITELNNVHTRGALIAAGRWALDRYKPASPVAFNLPADLKRSNMLTVIEGIGGGAQVMTPETAASHTIYHLARFTLRNDKAELDVIVPDGRGGYQMTQLRLVGRFEKWTVQVAREWETLVRPVPDLAYLPESDYPAQPEQEEIKPWRERIRGTNIEIEETAPPQ
jgi:hypothetical protein